MSGEQGRTENNPLISVIIPVYNVSAYVAECIESVLAQSYAKLEVIIVIDGPTDGSDQICEDYAQKDERIRCVYQENQGLSAARNIGLDCAKGEWIGFVDGDDWIEPDMFETLLRAATDSGAEIVNCEYRYEWVNASVLRKGFQNKKIMLRGREEILHGYNVYYRMPVWCKLWHKSFWESGYRFPVGRKHEDVDAYYAFLLRGGTLYCINNVLYHYRQRASSLSGNRNLDFYADLWMIRKAGFFAVGEGLPGDLRGKLLGLQSNVAYKIWNLAATSTKNVRRKNHELLEEISQFCRDFYPEVKKARMPRSIKIYYSIMRRPTSFAFRMIWLIESVRGALDRNGEREEKKRVPFD